MGHFDHIGVLIAVVGDEREEFRGDLVYRHERVLREPNEA
jgi:hypothetical protein